MKLANITKYFFSFQFSFFLLIFCCLNLVAIIITRLFMMISGLPHYTGGIVLQQPYQLSHPTTTSEQNFNKYSLEKFIYIKTWKAWSCHNNEAKLMKISGFGGMREEDLATITRVTWYHHHQQSVITATTSTTSTILLGWLGEEQILSIAQARETNNKKSNCQDQ